jgi:hypothetical protein
MTFDTAKHGYIGRNRNRIGPVADEQWEPSPVGGCDCIRPPWLNFVPSPPEHDQPNRCSRCGRPTRHEGECLMCNAEDLLGAPGVGLDPC